MLSSRRISQTIGTMSAGRCHRCFVSAVQAFRSPGVMVRPDRLLSSWANPSCFPGKAWMARFRDSRRRVPSSSAGLRLVSKIDIASPLLKYYSHF
jgi:hypothetical protein